MGKALNEEQLAAIAKQMRRDIISMLAEAGSGHPGGSLSTVEIMTYLYFKEMNVDPQKPAWPDRDRFVLSKGHAAPALYAALAGRGFFPREELMKVRKINSRLQGHPDMIKTPGVDMSTGSLGQGISAAVGMALAGKIDCKDYRVFVILGDGEAEEGQVWEAAMAAAHYKLDNLIVFLDHNGLQIDGPVTEVMSPEPIDEKYKAFGWHVQKINGHSFKEIAAAVETAKTIKGKPKMIIAETIKGKGVSFMENQLGWHGNAPSKEQAEQALAELA
ncbi:MAG TPA: transketolase [Peptococcaceae bacterium]|jgi:transketolase|nr:transketolase [Clostridia bacterium]HOB82059.1 transketolase [Peptococcaceae bacterium]HPZ71607.1 transketolase [Peptococcaceae bacterium]HQD54167.1 transketolase [Peptococcaceae bacterium]